MPEVGMLRVVALYPNLMNIYADRGNLLVLRRRCEWRGIGFEMRGVGVGDEPDEGWANLYYLGGGQDRDQELCAEDLRTHKSRALKRAVADGAVVLGVCGGYQLLGHSYRLDDRDLPGLGLLDVITTRSDAARLVGNVAIEAHLPGAEGRVLAGFENHAGRTRLSGRSHALGRVLRGHGNNGSDGYEGARSGRVLGTYLHGPLLPKNVWFADWLIAASLDRTMAELEPLDDTLEAQAHGEARKAAGL